MAERLTGKVAAIAAAPFRIGAGGVRRSLNRSASRRVTARRRKGGRCCPRTVPCSVSGMNHILRSAECRIDHAMIARSRAVPSLIDQAERIAS